MKKIPRRLLWQLDAMFFLTIILLAVGWMLSSMLALTAALLALVGYGYVFYQLKCPHCRRNIMPWTAAKARQSVTQCPHCGMQLQVE